MTNKLEKIFKKLFHLNIMDQTKLSELINNEIKLQVEQKFNERINKINNYKNKKEAEINISQLELKETEYKISKDLEKIEKMRQKNQDELKIQKIYIEEANKQLQIREDAINSSVRDLSKERLISLNIGGTVFYTLKTTLSNISPFFANLFSDQWRDQERNTIRDADGHIFIDRSPKYFEELLNWARNGGQFNEINKLIQYIKSKESDNGISFLRTLDYFGIDYKIFPNIKTKGLAINERIVVYWRGDKQYYSGTVESIKNTYHDLTKDIEIIVKYNDGDLWRYLLSKLNKSSKLVKLNKCINTKWVHYRSELGSEKLLT